MHKLPDGFGCTADLTKDCTVYLPGRGGHPDGISIYFHAPTLEAPERIATRYHLQSLEQAKRIAVSYGFRSIQVVREA